MPGGAAGADLGADVVAWERDDWLIAINFAAEARPIDAGGEIVIATEGSTTVVLAPGEAMVLRR